MNEIRLHITAGNVFKRIVICAAILLLGTVGMAALTSMRKPPAEAKPTERTLKVEVQRAEARDVAVSISGYGEVHVLNEVSIAPEVSGRVVHVHPRLDVGEVIGAGEVLFALDARNYQAALDEARSSVAQLESTIARLRRQDTLDRQRLVNLDRSRDLARSEFERLRTLFSEHNVGTRSAVDGAERTFNAAGDQADQMAQALALYPLQIREAESRLAAAGAGLALARANLARCRVTAPFAGRVKLAAVEIGQFVAPGQAVVTLADDRELEIQVSLDSRDARRWLRFDGRPSGAATAWFNGLRDESVPIRWTEDTEDHPWYGRLHRVVAFDQQTRTLKVAVRIGADAALSQDSARLPLVEGMFCRVEIPGRTLKGVVALPRWAVSMQGTAYVARAGRLKTVPVDVVRAEGDRVYVAGGLTPGDLVITTRLIDPLENALLEITPGNPGGGDNVTGKGAPGEEKAS